MTDQEVFEVLFGEARKSHDIRGAVAACLVDGDTILACAASADDGVRHAEDLVLEKLQEEGKTVTPTMILYTTKEPNTKRTFASEHQDCTTLIIDAGITQVVFGALNLEQHEEVTKRLAEAGVTLRQVTDTNLIEESERIFNATDTSANPSTN